MTPRRLLLAVAALLAVTLAAGALMAAGGLPRASAAPTPSPSPSPTIGPTALPTPSPSPTAPPTPSPSSPPTPAPPTATALHVPILYYHRALPMPADIGAWSYDQRQGWLRTDTLPGALALQLDWLAENGYRTILPRDLAAHWDHGAPLPPRPVILSFDDGYPEWLTTVLPLLRAHGMVAQFYCSVERIGPTGVVGQLKQLAAAGNGIGAHDVHHVQLAGLRPGVAPAPVEVMRYELTAAKQTIEAKTGLVVDSMAYVGGGFDATLVGLVRAAGYTTARAIVRGVWQWPGDRWTLHVSKIGVFDDLVDPTACVEAPSSDACAVQFPLVTFPLRVSGAAPG